jgi:hypothetical protein
MTLPLLVGVHFIHNMGSCLTGPSDQGIQKCTCNTAALALQRSNVQSNQLTYMPDTSGLI